MARHGILARTAVLDAQIKAFLEKTPDAVVLNLGAGLDTRGYRLGGGAARWYDVDLPPVAALRKKALMQNDKTEVVAASVLDSAWLDGIKYASPDRVLIVAEGLLMYFAQCDVKRIVEMLADKFPGAQMLFDVVHHFFVNKKIGSEFLWGVSGAQDIEALSPRIKLREAWRTGDLLLARQPLLLRLMNILPGTRGRSWILHIGFERGGVTAP